MNDYFWEFLAIGFGLSTFILFAAQLLNEAHESGSKYIKAQPFIALMIFAGYGATWAMLNEFVCWFLNP